VALGAAEDLVVLVAVAGEHDAVVGARAPDRAGDRAAPVGDHLERARETHGHVAQDRVGIFGARVVTGRDHEVRVRARRARHRGALGLVAIAAAAEDRDQLSAHVRPNRGEHALE
jgi:hypothetical protein